MNNGKLYDLGVVCGRFSHEHLGHVKLFDTCISLCNHTLILVGSAQESGTLRNPFTLETRIKIIRETYPDINDDQLVIKGINDLKNEYNAAPDWGKFLKKNVEKHMNKFADLMVYGGDTSRSKWFDQEDLINTAELILPRTANPISATLVRGLLVIDDKANWKKCTPKLIHKFYSDLRTELLNVTIYAKIYDTLKNEGLTIENYMKIYSKLELEDKAIKEKILGK